MHKEEGIFAFIHTMLIASSYLSSGGLDLYILLPILCLLSLTLEGTHLPSTSSPGHSLSHHFYDHASLGEQLAFTGIE